MGLSWLRDYVRDAVERGIKEALAPLAPYLRKLAGGVILMALSLFAFSLVLLSLAGALFFALAGLPYAIAALWTALIFFVIGLAILGAGAGMVRRPRGY